MNRRILVALVASWAVVGAIAPAHAAATYAPGNGYTAGPVTGDNRTQKSADPNTGEVMIFQTNTRQAAAVHCIGDGPVAKLRVSHPVDGDVSTVTVHYDNATMSEHPVIDVTVEGSKTGWLGHGNALGPKVNESGEVKIPLGAKPVPGETMLVTFGMQVGAGCMNHPQMLGLAGSRYAEGGQATFSSVEIS